MRWSALAVYTGRAVSDSGVLQSFGIPLPDVVLSSLHGSAFVAGCTNILADKRGFAITALRHPLQQRSRRNSPARFLKTATGTYKSQPRPLMTDPDTEGSR